MYRWDVFIAYASPDRAVAEALYTRLADGGLRVFLDEKVLDLGDDWIDRVPAELEASQVSVVLLSKQSKQAHYLKAELARFQGRNSRELAGRRVVPLLLEEGDDTLYGLENI